MTILTPKIVYIATSALQIRFAEITGLLPKFFWTFQYFRTWGEAISSFVYGQSEELFQVGWSTKW